MKERTLRNAFAMLRTALALLLFLAPPFAMCNDAVAAPPEFPALDAAKRVRGELVSADFIHRTGEFRTAAGKLISFRMPPYAVFQYRGVEADLRDVPLGTELEFLLMPDENGQPTQLIATKHGDTADQEFRNRFIEFTKARGLAGWIDQTAGNLVTVTFFSGSPAEFETTWGSDFSQGKAVRVCVANNELRTWNPTSTGEHGMIVKAARVPITGVGCSGWQVTIKVDHMLEGFRQGRVVRVFGPGWKVRNQLFKECLINYGYQSRGSQYESPDFSENHAQHYPEQFPYRTDYGNQHLSWFQAEDDRPLPSYSEHLMLGELIRFDPATLSGQFKTEQTGEVMQFTMFSSGPKTPVIRFQTASRESSKRTRQQALPLGLRYRFHMYQDASGVFSRCSYISDEYSQLALNGYNYQIQKIDLPRGRIEVAWQSVPVQNYQKEKETPPPFGHSLLRISPETRVWKGETPAQLGSLRKGDALRINLTSEQPGQPAYCSDLWIIE